MRQIRYKLLQLPLYIYLDDKSSFSTHSEMSLGNMVMAQPHKYIFWGEGGGSKRNCCSLMYSIFLAFLPKRLFCNITVNHSIAFPYKKFAGGGLIVMHKEFGSNLWATPYWDVARARSDLNINWCLTSMKKRRFVVCVCLCFLLQIRAQRNRHFPSFNLYLQYYHSASRVWTTAAK